LPKDEKEIAMEKAAKETNPEEILVTTEQIVAEATVEGRGAPSRLRDKLRRWEIVWERAGIQFYQAPKN
jgi:hypothetical protein